MYIKISELWLFKDVKVLKEACKMQLLNNIKLVSAEIDEYCNTRFEPTEDSYFHDLCEKFHTRRQPLVEVTSLKLCGCGLKENRDFFVYPEDSRIEIEDLNAKRYKKALEINYLFGYSEVPATVKQVIVDLLKLDAETKNSPLQGMQSENWNGEYSYARQSSKDFTPAELRKNILSRLDIFKIEPFTEVKNTRVARARLI